jgi:hypothetical protein
MTQTQIRLAQRRFRGSTPQEVRRRFDALIAGFADSEELLGYLKDRGIKGLCWWKHGPFAHGGTTLMSSLAHTLCRRGLWARIEWGNMLRIAGPGKDEDSLAPLPELASSVQLMFSSGLLDESYYGAPVPPPSR